MAKDKSFAAKIAKAAGLTAAHCPECGEIRSSLFVVDCVKSQEKASHKFKENFIAVCKCNENEIMS